MPTAPSALTGTTTQTNTDNNKTATKMLASTMQISKYGRHHHQPPPHHTPSIPNYRDRHARGRFEEAAAQTLMSQDPTVCQNPTPPDLHPRFHTTPPTNGAQDSSTKRHRVRRGQTTRSKQTATSRRSTSEHPPPTDIRCRSERNMDRQHRPYAP